MILLGMEELENNLERLEKEVSSLLDEIIKLKAEITEKDKFIEDLRVILEGISEKSDILY